jgi:hypothetical protein
MIGFSGRKTQPPKPRVKGFSRDSVLNTSSKQKLMTRGTFKNCTDHKRKNYRHKPDDLDKLGHGQLLRD